jgi:transposase
MRSTVAQSIGVDISKDALDVAIHPGGESFRITNNLEGHRALIKRLKGFDLARIVFEATGAYHRLFQQALVEAGLPWVKVNPCQARRFAQATGKLAKTDRCDALMLARMGAVLDLETRAPASKTVEVMRELVNARDARPSPSRPSSSVSSLRGCARSAARSKRSIDASKHCATQTRTCASGSTS